MAFLEMNCYSHALKMRTAVNVLLPEYAKDSDKTGAVSDIYKTLWLFHGLSGDHTDWMRRSLIERYAESHGIAVVMPNVGRSWYTDTAYDAGYFTYVTEELPEICRSYFKGMSDRRENNIVAGLSMGGYGALKSALTYPEKYCACISLSGSLDITRKGRPTNVNEWKGIFDFDLESPNSLAGTEHDLFALAQRLHDEKRNFPYLYLWCGTEDSLINTNRNFDALLNELGVPHFFEQSEGDHSWRWWDMHIRLALKHILDGGQ